MKSVFISYAHKDGKRFTERLAFALEFYMDVFWDRRLPAGEFQDEIKSQIEKRDYFLQVLTPYSRHDRKSEDGSETNWCKKEYDWASESYQERGLERRIVFANVFGGTRTIDPNLVGNTYADFSEDFDVGFKRLTFQMLGEPKTAWEYFERTQDAELIGYLKDGYIPTAIAKDVSDWLIADQLWSFVVHVVDAFEYNRKSVQIPVVVKVGEPRRPFGVIRMINDIEDIMYKHGDNRHRRVLRELAKVAAAAMKSIETVADNQHKDAGQIVFNLFTQVRGSMTNNLVTPIASDYSRYALKYLEFNLAEKLRELISTYSRRSRYLY